MPEPLERIQRNWSAWGRKDPMFAILVDEEKKGNRWDESTFFDTGRAEVTRVLAHTEQLGLTVRRGSALDFGCGVGRLTQALCEHFDSAVGVDIADSMVERARVYNKHGSRCEYRVNLRPDLKMFDDSSFDFVYTNIVLQHIPGDLSRRYIPDLIRILKPQGVAVFNCPSRRLASGGRDQFSRAGKEAVRTVVNGAFRPLGITPLPRMEMHGVPWTEVEEIVAQSNARLVETRPTAWGAVGWENYTYTVLKD